MENEVLKTDLGGGRIPVYLRRRLQRYVKAQYVGVCIYICKYGRRGICVMWL